MYPDVRFFHRALQLHSEIFAIKFEKDLNRSNITYWIFKNSATWITQGSHGYYLPCAYVSNMEEQS